MNEVDDTLAADGWSIVPWGSGNGHADLDWYEGEVQVTCCGHFIRVTDMHIGGDYICPTCGREYDVRLVTIVREKAGAK